MSQAEALLNSIAAYPTTNTDSTVSTSPINDYLIIDAEGRFINVPATETLFGVETDMNAERKYFQCLRIVGDNIDLTKLGLRVNYRNALGEEDGYIVDDVKVEGEFITFSWKLGKKLFAEKGTIYFTVCAVSVDADGYETCHWNTTLASGTVLEGLHVDLTASEHIAARDLLQQLLNQLNTRSNEAVQAVTDEGTKQIDNVEAAGSEQMDLVRSKGAETISTIPADYTVTYRKADDAVRKKACAILVEEEDEVICLNDASDDYVRGLKVFGKTEQVSTTGKNLLRITTKTQTLNGVTFTVNSDGSVTVVGTATANTNCLIASDPPSAYGPKSIRFGGGVVGSENTYFFQTNTYKGEVGTSHFDYDGKGTVVNLDNPEITKVDTYVRVKSGVTVNTVFYPMAYDSSIGDSTYEPYTGGKPAPNPEYPQDIVSVGNVGGINAIVGSRNLFSKNSTNESNSMILFPGTYYCKRFFGDSTETNARLHIKIGDSWKMIESVGKYDNSNIIVEESAFSWYKDKQKLTLNKSYELFYGLPQGEKLTIAINEYLESYEDDNNSFIIIPRSLPGIPVSTGGNYTDSDGQQWICDEVDFERGVYVKRVGEIILTGDETYIISGYSTDNYNAFYNTDPAPNILHGTNLPVISTHFSCKKSNDPFGDEFGIVAGISNLAIYYFVPKTDYPDLESWSTYLSEQHANGTPVKTLYLLEEPIETPLTAGELNAFRALHTNYPNTVVMNDSGATMRLLYNADTKTFVIQNGGKPSEESITNAVNNYLDEHPVSVDPLVLTDTTTNKRYRISVVSGKLTMTEVTN